VDRAETMRNAYELINAGDIAGFSDLVAADFVEHEAVPGFPPTKDGVLAYFQSLLASFPDMRMEIEDLIASGDRAMARVGVTATHQGESWGRRRPATVWRCSSSTS
jgi:ketosteroid isomerase-like protein